MVVIPNKKPWHLATNFLRASVGESAKGKCRRYDNMSRELSQATGKITTYKALELLAEVSESHTQWSIVYGISTGNIVGSDLFNLLGVLGLAGLLRPVEVNAMSRISLVALCGMVFLVLVLMRTGWRLTRLEGLTLITVAAMRWGLDFATHR